MTSQLKLDFAVSLCYYSLSDKRKVESFPTFPKTNIPGYNVRSTLQVSAFPFVAIREALKGGLFFGQGGDKAAMSDLVCTYVYECVECREARHKTPKLLRAPWRCFACWWDIQPKVNKMKEWMINNKGRIIRERGGRCEDCNTTESKLVVHHILPINWGGTNDPENLRVLCKPCHKTKHPHGTKWYEGATHEAAGLVEIQYREWQP